MSGSVFDSLLKEMDESAYDVVKNGHFFEASGEFERRLWTGDREETVDECIVASARSDERHTNITGLQNEMLISK